MDEGVIRYRNHMERKEVVLPEMVADIIQFRTLLWEKKLIGVTSEGIGYGNISKRICGTNNFIISASATGGIPELRPADFAWVTDFNIGTNEVWCRGLKEASSESLTHASVYQNAPLANVVVHVHSNKLWKKNRNILPATPQHIEYGTPEMAYEVGILASKSKKGTLVIIMGGHPDGLISFAPDFDTAINNLLSLR